MKIASVSEAKAKLSALLELVKAGETVTVTERGVPVARIVPAVNRDAGDDEARLQRLERAGIIRRGRGGSEPNPILLEPGPRIDGVVELLLEERRQGR
jgi:prevent-host-death family protein